ncbi:MAG: AAA family ATPase [Candidatus Bathyarchaeia archaeon]
MASSRRSSIFKEGGIEKLSVDYVPERLPHRESELRDIVEAFRPFLEHPHAWRKVLIHGPTGTGKTVTAKKAGEILSEISKEMGVKFKYAHVNCRFERSAFGLVQEIIRQTVPGLPLRGYGPTEYLRALFGHLEDNDEILLLTLDEVDHLLTSIGDDILYALTRASETAEIPQRVSMILIAKDTGFLGGLRPQVLSKIRPDEALGFEPYGRSEIFDILSDRIEWAFTEGSVSAEAIRFISRNASLIGGGDARYAIQLLLTAGLVADREGSKRILPEHIREAQEKIDPRIDREDLLALSDEEKRVLLAVAKTLRIMEEVAYAPLETVRDYYEMVCEERGIVSAEGPPLEGILERLEALGLIDIEEGVGVSLPLMRARALEEFLETTS